MSTPKAFDSGSLARQKKKINSKVMLDKAKLSSGTIDDLAELTKGASSKLGGAANKFSGAADKKMGKNTLKSLGFKTARPSLNFYEHWKVDEYPSQVLSIFESLMKSVGVGVVPLNANDEDWVGNFMQTLHGKLTESSEAHYGLIPKNNRKLMRSVIDECEKMIESQSKLEKIVRGQSLIRGYLTRKEIREWIDEKDVKFTKTKRHICNLAFRELLVAEKDYIKDLNVIVNTFVLPLRKMSELRRTSISITDMANMLPGLSPQTAVTLSKEDQEAIFSNVETLLKVHTRINQRLQALREKWPFIDNFGEAFLKIAPELIVYGDYVQNSKNSVDTILRIQDSDPRFKTFLETNSGNGADLIGLLVRPLNHVNHYSSCLRVLVNNIPEDDPDTENLRNAYAAIKKTGKFITEMYSNSTNRAKIADIQRRGVFPKGVTFEHVPKRAFISEGHIVTVEKTLGISMDKQRVYFLFNDVMLNAEESGKQLKIQHIHTLKDATLEDMNTPNAYQFAIVNGPTKVIYSLKNSAEKTQLMKKIKECIDNLNVTHKMFGVSLHKLLEREKPTDGIPFLVKSCAEYIKKSGKEMEGIFRISGGTAEVANLKAVFNQLETLPKEPLDLKAHSPYAVAAVLKMFFRELPEPIFGFNAFKPLTSLGLDQDQKVCIAAIKNIVATVPKENIVVLKYLATFLQGIARYSTVNKMNLSNLAIVFGPNLCFPSEETLETILLIPKLNGVSQFVFENAAAIFDM